MVLRRQIIFALAVAVAGVRHRAGDADAQLVDHVLRPAAAAGFALEQMLGGELVAGAIGDDMALEIGLAAEQPEAAPDLPFDGDAGVGLLGSAGLRYAGLGGLRDGTAVEARTSEECGQNGGEERRDNRAHRHPGASALVALPMRQK